MDNSKFWNNAAISYNDGKYDVDFSHEKYRMSLAIDYIIDKDIDSILDIGSGTGEFLNKCNFIKKRIGIDFSAEMVKTAENNFPHLDFECSSIEEYETNLKFDLITSFSVLPYIENDICVYEKINSLLKDDGLFIASYPNNLFNMFTDNNLTYDFMKNNFYSYLDDKHLKEDELSSINFDEKAKFPDESARGIKKDVEFL